MKTDGKGHIYVLSNPCFRYLKIGFTQNDPVDRCAQLSRMQAIPKPFKIEQTYVVKNPRQIERAIHSRFKSFRVGKEFFDISLDDVKAFLDERVRYQTDFEYFKEVIFPLYKDTSRTPKA